MGRPLKLGLDTCPLNIDFYDDPRLRPIIGEFGVIKGMCVVVMLLCAIYREGYFIKWDEDARKQLLVRLQGISAGLLDTMVRRLVKWDYFDKELFDSAQILTSREIQDIYFANVKRRKIDDSKLDYLLTTPQGKAQEGTGEFMYTETHNESAKKKTKKSNQKKLKEKEEIIEDKSSQISLNKKKNKKEDLFLEKKEKAAKVMTIYNTAIQHYKKTYPDGWECCLALAQKVTKERVEPLCYIADNYTEVEIKRAFWNATKSDYCNGRKKDRPRPADIMWLVRPKVFIRLLEGNV